MTAIVDSLRIFRYSVLGSTNDQTRTLISAGKVPPNFIVVASKQTSGRGRAGKAWQSMPGNLFCSFALAPSVPAIRLSEISLVVAVALQAAIASVLPFSSKPKIKWPNDILIDGSKISGILLEVMKTPGQDCSTVITGVGVNIVSRPRSLDRPSTCLLDFGYAGDAQSFLEILTGQFLSCMAGWEKNGFNSVRQAWLDHAVGLGEEIAIRCGNILQEGLFETLDGTGALVLRLPGGSLRTITAGDVFLG